MSRKSARTKRATGPDPRRDLVDMLRDEYEAIHGPLPGDWLTSYLEAARIDLPVERTTTDQRLAALYSRIHSLPDESSRSAVCLSGGGIRSAAFSFGALRAMARAGVLERFHYLSTVSGGGYIGSWLTAWIHRFFSDTAGTPRTERLAHVCARFAAGAGNEGLGGDRPPEAGPVSHVRRFTNYLSPQTGAFSLDTWTLAAVYVRNLLLNWLVVLPLLAAVLLVPWLLVHGAEAAGLVTGTDPGRLAVLLVPASLSLLVWLILILTAALGAQSDDPGSAEERARLEAQFLRFAIFWAALSGLVLYGPAALAAIPSLLAAAGGISGLLTIVLKKLGDRTREERGAAERSARLARVATTAAAVLTIVLVLVGVAAGAHSLAGSIQTLLPGDDTAPAGAVLSTAAFIVGTIAISALAALVVDINEFSLHALYRNRLVRGFLRASRGQDAAESDTEFDPADDLPLASLWPSGPASGRPDDAPHLFHVINATLNDLGGTRPEWSERKGVSFTFSPLHLGAHIAGRYGEVSRSRSGFRCLDRSDTSARALRLGTAMSISGAAASPNMGYHSSAAVTFLLALFNVRLGWWLPAPWGEVGPLTLRRSPGAVWRAWWAEAFGATRFNSPVLNVSDGGHFDNLGLYEMVRRRCRSIIVLDAGQDSRRTFAALGEAIRKIRVDFGVPITFTGLDFTAGAADNAATPRQACAGTIHYSRADTVKAGDGGLVPAENGTIIYIRPAVLGDEPADVQAYGRLHRGFPHQSTADQWFSESQFESYRMLGEHTIQRLVDYYDSSKGQVRPRTAGASSTSGGVSPDLFCHQITEALVLMRRQRMHGSHAGGVVYRIRDGRLQFLLVRSTDGRNRILPKGFIEPWEHPISTAVREVREETGYDLQPVRNLREASFETPTRRVTTTYFLMQEPTDETRPSPYEDYRKPDWFTISEAAAARPPIPEDVIEILRDAEAALLTHAGGVACRERSGETEFLLVRSSDGSRHVLPKGHIEKGEGPAEAAQREVAEESGYRFAAGPSVGIFAFRSGTEKTVVEYFLMRQAAKEVAASSPEPARHPRWVTLDEAAADPLVPPDVVLVLQAARALL